MAYIKKAIPVYVRFASDDGVIKTLEGVVPYKAGDAILTGQKNEQWPISRDRFINTYSPSDASMTVGDAGLYVKKPIVVEAFQVKSKTEIVISDGKTTLIAEPDDWIVESDNGDRWVVDKEVFLITYMKISNKI